jgi:hypothetical protein
MVGGRTLSGQPPPVWCLPAGLLIAVAAGRTHRGTGETGGRTRGCGRCQPSTIASHERLGRAESATPSQTTGGSTMCLGSRRDAPPPVRGGEDSPPVALGGVGHCAARPVPAACLPRGAGNVGQVTQVVASAGTTTLRASLGADPASADPYGVPTEPHPPCRLVRYHLYALFDTTRLPTDLLGKRPPTKT